MKVYKVEDISDLVFDDSQGNLAVTLKSGKKIIDSSLISDSDKKAIYEFLLKARMLKNRTIK